MNWFNLSFSSGKLQNFQDPQELFRQELLFTVLKIPLFFTFLFLVVSIFYAPLNNSIPFHLTSLLVLLVTYKFNQQNKTLKGSWFLCISLWIVFQLVILFNGGIKSPAMWNLVVVLFLATLLIGKELALLLIVLTGLSVWGLWLLEQKGMLPNPLTQSDRLTYLLVFVCQFSIVASLMYLTVRSLEKIMRAHAEKNKILQETTISKRKFSSQLDLIPYPLLILNQEERIMEGNALAKEQLFFPEEMGAFSSFEKWLSFSNPSMETKDWRTFQDKEILLLTSDRKKELFSCSVWEHQKGEPIWVAALKPLEQEKEMQLRLQHLKLASEETTFAKSRFLANMSHELRTPLNTIIGYSELLKEDYEGEKIVGEELKKISSASHHLIEMIDDVLALSKIEAGKMQCVSELFSLPHFCFELQFKVQALNDKGLLVHYDTKDLPEFFLNDRQKLEEILLHLVSNAIKFTNEGSIFISAKTECRNQRDGILWSVQDSGIGISAEQHKKLFQKFEYIEDFTTRSFEGLGLGLVLCLHFARFMEGMIWHEPTTEAGSLFRFWVPNQKETIGKETK